MGLIGSAVFTFIKYTQTNRQANYRYKKTAKYYYNYKYDIDVKILLQLQVLYRCKNTITITSMI